MPENRSPHDGNEEQFFSEVTDKFLFYGREVDGMLLTTLGTIAAQ